MYARVRPRQLYAASTQLQACSKPGVQYETQPSEAAIKVLQQPELKCAELVKHGRRCNVSSIDMNACALQHWGGAHF